MSPEAIRYSPSVRVYVEEIARKLKAGKAAIMVGAGFSRNVAPNQHFPDWKELGNIILKRLKGNEPDGNGRFLSVPRLAGELEALHGRNTLDELVQQNIPDMRYEPSELHVRLLELPWVDIVTTNYDTFLERARTSVGSRKYDLVQTKEDLVLARSPRIVKLHGSFPSHRPLILTEEDYRKYPQDFSFFVNTVQQSLVENLLCLIGFSGDDPNFLNWIGWIRDNFGKNFTPKIYLLCVGDVAESQRALLEQRNVIPVNLAVEGSDGRPPSHVDVFRHFFQYLEEALVEAVYQWGTTGTIHPDDRPYETNCRQIISEWERSRLSYPGWVIPPYVRRNTLWAYTLEWFKYYTYQTEYEALPEDIQFAFTYELCWRLEKCLYPLLGDVLVNRCDAFIQNRAKWVKDNFNQWFDLALWLLREYRTDGKFEKWVETSKILDEYLNQTSGEQKAKLHYEKCMYAILTFDIPLLKRELATWPECRELPFWEAKKAALYAETGDYTTARKILETSLALVRKLQNESPEEDRIRYLSQEGCISLIFERFECSESVVLQKFEQVNLVRGKYDARHKYLRQFDCSPNDDLLVFSLGLKGTPSLPPLLKTEIPRFDIGVMTINHKSGYVDQESLLADSFLLFSEETGIPYKLPGIDFDKETVAGAIKRVSKNSFAWAIASFVRTGKHDQDSVDMLLDRKSLASLRVEQIDFYVTSLIEAVKNAKEHIESQSANAWCFNWYVHFPQVAPEILSRFCARCSYESLQMILDFLLYLYSLKKKVNYKGVANLAKRLLSNWPPDGAADLINVLYKIPHIAPSGVIIDQEFPDLWTLFDCTLQASLAPDERRINEALEAAASENLDIRSSGIAILTGMCSAGLLNDQQKEQFKVLLWKKIDPQTGFPLLSQTRQFYMSVFIRLPYPEATDVVELFKQHTLKERNEFFPIGTGTISQSASGPAIVVSKGYSHLLNEWKVGYGIFQENRVPLNEAEATWMLNVLYQYWNRYSVSPRQERTEVSRKV